MLTGDRATDLTAARAAAETVGDLLQPLIAHGMDPAVLAMAVVAIGAGTRSTKTHRGDRRCRAEWDRRRFVYPS
jgi:hypothetical protein